MKKLILSIILIMVFVPIVSANDFSDVGPESLFWDYHGTNDDHDYGTNSLNANINDQPTSAGRPVGRDTFEDNRYRHDDVIPRALLEPDV